LNNKPIPQVQRIRYLGIIFDKKLAFKEHIDNIATKCTKLIFSLSKAAKLNWGLNHKALKTIYLGGILPILLYGAPVWCKALALENCKTKLRRVQRIINIKIAKAYRTVSNEALCVLTGMTPINIKIEEVTKLYHQTSNCTKDNEQYDKHKEARFWQHPAETIIRASEETKEDSPHQIYTDGSKTERGVGSGIAVYSFDQNVRCLQFKLHKKCTNNQAEQLAILKALEYIDDSQTTDKKAAIYTDSRTTIDMLQNGNIHANIIEDIRRQWYKM